MSTSQPAAGLGVDAAGGPVIDPTANVISLVQANKEAADALRDMHDRYIGAEIGVVKETVKWLGLVSEIHQSHDREIHKMEQEKLAAFRQSDEAARLTEANRQLAAIEVLARTTQTNADNLRNALDATASTIAKQNAETNSEIYQRLAALEKSSYEGAGKQAVADPMQTEMIAEMRRVSAVIASNAGQGKGMDKMWGYAIGAIGLLVLILRALGKI